MPAPDSNFTMQGEQFTVPRAFRPFNAELWISSGALTHFAISASFERDDLIPLIVEATSTTGKHWSIQASSGGSEDEATIFSRVQLSATPAREISPDHVIDLAREWIDHSDNYRTASKRHLAFPNSEGPHTEDLDPSVRYIAAMFMVYELNTEGLVWETFED